MQRNIVITARLRNISARGRGSNTYAMIGLPGSGKLIWADKIDGAEILHDSYPRSYSIRARDRHGRTLISVPLPIGAVIVWIDKSTDGRIQKWARVVTENTGDLVEAGEPGAGQILATSLLDVDVTSRRRGDGWITVINDVEFE
jgi:hypothetical protein